MMSYGKHESREWALDEGAAEPIVRTAVEGGVTFFDTADVYNGGQSEVVTGRLLARLFGMREEYVLATKVHGRRCPARTAAAFAQARARVDRRLARAGWATTTSTSTRSTAGIRRRRSRRRWRRCTTSCRPAKFATSALEHVRLAVRQGPEPSRGWTPFVSMQNHYNLVYREEEREMIPHCIDQGVGVLPWSPLARGLLAGTRHARASASPRARRRTRSATASIRRSWTSPSSIARRRSPRPGASRRRRSRSRGCCTSRE